MNTYTTMQEETYSRTESGKNWKTKPDTVTSKDLTEQHYNNMTSVETSKFFRRIGGSETATREYTSKGYIITRLVSCDPSRTIRKVRTFVFA